MSKKVKPDEAVWINPLANIHAKCELAWKRYKAGPMRTNTLKFPGIAYGFTHNRRLKARG